MSTKLHKACELAEHKPVRDVSSRKGYVRTVERTTAGGGELLLLNEMQNGALPIGKK